MRGMVAVMFSDIVGSTRLWSEHENEMAHALELHDRIVSDTIESVGGSVFKHTGDGVGAVFAGHVDAIRAAAAIQVEIASADWPVPGGLQVRVSVHSGAVHERAGDLFGPTLNRTARLLERCPPGAVLVSEVTAALVDDALPDELELRPLGRVKLRDLGHSERVFAVFAPYLRAIDGLDLSAPKSGGGTVGWLPATVEPIIGRADAVAAVESALAEAQVVTVTAIGGMGKTRVALAAATATASAFADGVWWCDLAKATTGEAVAVVVLGALGTRQLQGVSVVASIVDFLGEHETLLVLDNCEHVRDAVVELVDAVALGCARTRVLATSRDHLGVGGERVIALAPLSLNDAAELFTARARDARSDLELDAGALDTVRQICAQLECLPLAVELAAARCRSLSLAEVSAHVDDRFKLLRGGRSGIERHRTLEAAIEWSYMALEPDERHVFDHLAAFPGGAMLDALAATCRIDELDAVDVVDRLAGRGMVIVLDTPLGTRYRQLETLRQYAELRQREAGTLEAVRAAQRAWCGEWCAPLRRVMATAGEVAGFRRFMVEIDNLRDAVASALVRGLVGDALAMMHATLPFALARPSFEMLDWIDRETLIGAVGRHDDALPVIGLLAQLALYVGDMDAFAALLDGIAEVSCTDVHVAVARSQQLLWVLAQYDPAEALLLAAESHTQFEEWMRRLYLLQVNIQRLTAPEPDPALVADTVDLGRALVDEARPPGISLTLATGLSVLSYAYVNAERFDEAIEASSLAIEVALDADALFLVDAAQFGVAGALGGMQRLHPNQPEKIAPVLRDILAEALERRSHLLVQSMFAAALPATLWALGDHETALLVQRVSLRYFTQAYDPLPADALDVVGPEMVSIVEEAAQGLDLTVAAQRALASLDRANTDGIASHDGA